MKDEKDPPPPREGPHELHPHDHSHVPEGWRFAQRCSGKFWCLKCLRWSGGEKCILPAVRAA